MVVDYFDVERVTLDPAKADAPLVIDTDAVLPLAVAFERFQPIAGRQGLSIVVFLGARRLDVKRQITSGCLAFNQVRTSPSSRFASSTASWAIASEMDLPP
jgi:hypothetical protein